MIHQIYYIYLALPQSFRGVKILESFVHKRLMTEEAILQIFV